MAKRKAPKKVRVYFEGDRGLIEYVPRAPSDLRPELERVQADIRLTLRILHRARRYRHVAVSTARFQLENCLRDTPAGASDEWLADEIARLSYVMEDTLGILNRLKHSRMHYLEEARFRLTYGQTPKKRDPPGAAKRKGTSGSFDPEGEGAGEDG